jgi:hypothetical protein
MRQPAAQETSFPQASVLAASGTSDLVCAELETVAARVLARKLQMLPAEESPLPRYAGRTATGSKTPVSLRMQGQTSACRAVARSRSTPKAVTTLRLLREHGRIAIAHWPAIARTSSRAPSGDTTSIAQPGLPARQAVAHVRPPPRPITAARGPYDSFVLPAFIACFLRPGCR